MPASSRKIALPGERFGRLTILHEAETAFTKSGERLFRYRLRCDCGAEIETKIAYLRCGDTTSCGCAKIERFKEQKFALRHGQSKTRTWKTWSGVQDRCLNPNDKNYKNYGGRGIRVCDRWLVFENFLEDMGHVPDGLSIDRINNDGNYEPGNCRWATVDQQKRNKRGVYLVSFRGETTTFTEALRALGIDQSAGAWYAKKHNMTRQQVLDHYIENGVTPYRRRGIATLKAKRAL